MASSKPLAPSSRPDRKGVKKEKAPPQFTPASAVSKMALHPVFVYGSLKKGFQLHDHYLKDQEFIGNAVVGGAILVDLGPYPAMVQTGNRDHRVAGEYYLVSDDVYNALKKMEEAAGYITVSIGGKFTSEQRIAKLDDSAFIAKAWVYGSPSPDTVADWSLMTHQGVNYTFIDYHDTKEKLQ